MCPLYHHLDLRADYRFNFEDWSLVTFFEAQNVYDRANVFQYVWNPKTRSRDPVNQVAASSLNEIRTGELVLVCSALGRFAPSDALRSGTTPRSDLRKS